MVRVRVRVRAFFFRVVGIIVHEAGGAGVRYNERSVLHIQRIENSLLEEDAERLTGNHFRKVTYGAAG